MPSRRQRTKSQKKTLRSRNNRNNRNKRSTLRQKNRRVNRKRSNKSRSLRQKRRQQGGMVMNACAGGEFVEYNATVMLRDADDAAMVAKAAKTCSNAKDACSLFIKKCREPDNSRKTNCKPGSVYSKVRDAAKD